MGLIINLPNGDKHYASTYGGHISINKIEIGRLPVYGEDGETFIRHNIIYKYNINGTFTIWPNKESYDERMMVDDSQYYNVDVKVQLDTIPSNLHESVYTKFKETLYSYEDDI
jgi:hypothetical protein